MNYQDYIKYDPEKKQYTDSYGYVIDGYTSKALPSEQRAQQPAKANRVSLIDTDSGVDPIVQATGGDTVNLILDAKGVIKTTKALVVGSSNTNQAWITTGANSVALQTAGTDDLINVNIYPKGTSGYVKFATNYSKYIAIMGGGNTKITTSQGTNADCDLTLESKGAGKLILANYNNGNTFETLEIVHANGSSTITTKSQFPVTYPDGDIIFVPRGLGVVNCNSWTYDGISSTGNPQTLPTGSNTRVRIDAATYNDFPAGFITFSGSPTDTFQNTCGRPIALMVTACIRETTFPTGRTLGLWIARSGDSTLQYGQAVLPPTTDTSNGRSLNVSSIIRLANNESFSIWAHSAVAGVVIGGPNNWERTIITFRLMP